MKHCASLLPNVLALDPGVLGTGWATSSSAGVWSPGSGLWQVRAEALAERLRQSLMQMRLIRKVALEEPSFFDSAKGSAAARRGDLVKLVHLVGMLHATALSCGRSVILVPVAWKGQMSKTAVMYRIRKRVGYCPESHAADALGILIHLSHGGF